jgi:transcriptional regulator with XRE-family HTH domain
MASSQLPNYLRSHRKRLALSQGEVAFLLGGQSGDKVCRDERFTRRPSLETALAYEAIFQKPVRELFGGLYQSIELDVTARSKTLVSRIERKPSNQRTIRKLRAIADITGRFNNTLTS